MNLKKLCAGLALTLVTASAVAANDNTIVHVTPSILTSQSGIPLPWSVNYQGYDFDIENETESVINIAIKVNTLNYSEGVALFLSSTFAHSGSCGLKSLNPGQVISCNIEPQGHLELDFNFQGHGAVPTDIIQGTYTLEKIQ